MVGRRTARTKKPAVSPILDDQDLKPGFECLQVSAQASHFLAHPNDGDFLVAILPRSGNRGFYVESSYAWRCGSQTFKKLVEQAFDDHAFYELVLIATQNGLPQLRIRQVERTEVSPRCSHDYGFLQSTRNCLGG